MTCYQTSMQAGPSELQPYLARLRALPFVRDVRVMRSEVDQVFDYELELRTESGKQRLLAEVKKSHWSPAMAEQLLSLRASARARDRARLLLLAPSVGRELGDLLERERVAFMDLAGNCYLGEAPERAWSADRSPRGPDRHAVGSGSHGRGSPRSRLVEEAARDEGRGNVGASTRGPRARTPPPALEAAARSLGFTRSGWS